MTAVAPAVVRAVASSALGVLAGPPRAAQVLAAGRGALVLDGGGRTGPALVLLVGPGAPRLPLTVHVAADLDALVPGMPARLGGGRVVVGDPARGGVEAVVTRWFDPTVRLARPYHPAAVAALAAVVAGHPGGDPAVGAGEVGALAAGLAGSTPMAPAVAALVGRGGGSTPAGDDVLAGALAALAAVGSPAAPRLAAAVAARTGTTTRLSAALLAHAARAEVAAAAAPLLAALTGGADVGGAAAPLLALGHTSGHHLAEGVAVGAATAGAVAR